MMQLFTLSLYAEGLNVLTPGYTVANNSNFAPACAKSRFASVVRDCRRLTEMCLWRRTPRHAKVCSRVLGA